MNSDKQMENEENYKESVRIFNAALNYAVRLKLTSFNTIIIRKFYYLKKIYYQKSFNTA